METRQHKQIRLAQNFLKNRELVHRLVTASTIGPSDIVYEIGAGRGIITAELARKAKRIIAIEKDPVLVRRLRERFQADNNVEIIEKDFLRYSIRESDHKIFANIPFNISASIVRKILYERPVPTEAYLILQKEAARKFSGRPKETLFSLLAKPVFEFSTLHRFKRTDFDPVPSVDSVLLLIKQRSEPLIETEDLNVYRGFIEFGFGRWKPSLRAAYKRVFTYKQWKMLSRELDFPLKSTPTQLNFEQWLGLFQAFKKRCENKTFVLEL